MNRAQGNQCNCRLELRLTLKRKPVWGNKFFSMSIITKEENYNSRFYLTDLGLEINPAKTMSLEGTVARLIYLYELVNRIELDSF